MKRTLGLLLLFGALLINNSCLNRHFIAGRTEIVSLNDTILKDSSIFVGYAHWNGLPSGYRYQGPFEIWIDNTALRTSSDSIGYYFIKVIPGTYTIKCQSEGNEWSQLIEEIKNIEIVKNKKIRIDFFIGSVAE